MSEASTAVARENRAAFKIGSVVLTIALLVLVAIQIHNGQFRELGVVSAIGVFVDLPIAVLASLCWIRGWSGSPRVMRTAASALAGGLICGGVSFALGFVGPLVLTPGPNLGPLLGIIVTGPIGFVLGAVGGAVYSHRRSSLDNPSAAAR